MPMSMGTEQLHLNIGFIPPTSAYWNLGSRSHSGAVALNQTTASSPLSDWYAAMRNGPSLWYRFGFFQLVSVTMNGWPACWRKLAVSSNGLVRQDSSTMKWPGSMR